MDPMGEEQLDYGEEDYGGGGGPKQQQQQQGYPGTIPALAEDEEAVPDDEDYDDLYNDVNVGESFMNTLQHQQQHRPDSAAVPSRNGAAPPAKPGSSIPGVGGAHGEGPTTYPEAVPMANSRNFQEGMASQRGPAETHVGNNVRFQGAPPVPVPPRPAVDPQFAEGPSSVPPLPLNPPPGPVTSEVRLPAVESSVNGPTTLFVGELQWWTTDAELEGMLSRYGRVKDIRFFDERASGKSKGYCQVEFYDAVAAAAAKDGVNGHVFNGRACVVAFASPQTLRQMGAAYASKNQPPPGQSQPLGRRMMNDGQGKGSGGGMNYHGRGGNWSRGGQGMPNRGQGSGGSVRGRGNMGGRNFGGAGMGAAASPFGQGLVGPALGGPAVGLMHPQAMMGAGFDPTYMGRGGPYGSFSAAAFPGMMPSFQAVNSVGLPAVAPHVNPAFFGRGGMSMNGMGMMGGSGMDGQSAGMWTDPSMSGWTGEEHGRRTRESSYGGDDGASNYGYGEVNHERGGRSNVSREKDRGSECDWSGNSEKRQRDEREDWERSDRERYREKDGYRDHRQRDRDRDNEEHSLRSGSRSKMMHEEEHRSHSRDIDYVKRRRSD